MKKFLAILLAAMMVLAMVVSANAAVVSNTTGHAYQAFAIFTGTQGEGEAELASVEWGSGVTTSGIIAALKADTVLGANTAIAALADDATAADVAAALSTATNAEAMAFAKIMATRVSGGIDIAADATSVDLPAGYYLLKDVAETNNQDDVRGLSLLQLTNAGNVTITSKTNKPTVDKQVQDETADAEAGNVGGYGESADHEIGEAFNFKLIAKIPADTKIDQYPKYMIRFNDTMEPGITFHKIVSVTVEGTAIDATQYACTATTNQAGGSWTLTIDDIKPLVTLKTTGEYVIEVVYEAELNENAVMVTVPGTTDTAASSNDNMVNLTYSNNPNAGGEGETGETPEDVVYVYTYAVDVQKVDGTTKEAIENVSFVLTGNGLPAAGLTATTDAEGKITFEGLDAGEYTLTEVSAPAGYNPIDPIIVKIGATHVENADVHSATNTTTLTPADNGVVVVENYKGAVLPETGSIGTTIFYVLGGLLVAGAVVLLVARRRMGANA